MHLNGSIYNAKKTVPVKSSIQGACKVAFELLMTSCTVDGGCIRCRCCCGNHVGLNLGFWWVHTVCVKTCEEEEMCVFQRLRFI